MLGAPGHEPSPRKDHVAFIETLAALVRTGFYAPDGPCEDQHPQKPKRQQAQQEGSLERRWSEHSRGEEHRRERACQDGDPGGPWCPLTQ